MTDLNADLNEIRMVIFAATEAAGVHDENSESAYSEYRQNRQKPPNPEFPLSKNSESAYSEYRQNRQKPPTRQELTATIEISEDPVQVRESFMGLCLLSLREIEEEAWKAQTAGALGFLALETGKWYGYLEALRLIDDDASLQKIQRLYHQAVARGFRKAREPAQASRLEKSLKAMKRVIASNPDMGALAAATEVVRRAGTDKKRVPREAEKLFLSHLEGTFNQAVERADSEWGNGETASHIQLAEYLWKDFFSALKPKERELAKNELKRRLKALAKEKYPERLYGSPGVKKDD